jgi:hypothetical protein
VFSTKDVGYFGIASWLLLKGVYCQFEMLMLLMPLGLLKMLITYYLTLGSNFNVLRVLTIAKGGGYSLKVFITITDVWSWCYVNHYVYLGCLLKYLSGFCPFRVFTTTKGP